MQKFNLSTIVPGYGGTDQIALLDSLEEARGEFARAGLGENSGGALEKCAIGDSRYVEESDRLLDKFETGRFETKSCLSGSRGRGDRGRVANMS